MRYGSVCSGIEAASVAWRPLGWEAAFFSEIEAFPSSVLAHHYGSNLPGHKLPGNGVPNLGDMTKFKDWPDYAIDLLVGGTPCQSFSIAGLRAGLADPRGNLMLTYLAIAARYRPRWLVWENVPGVLSSGKGRDFGSLLGGLGELGYGFAYRVLDAQFCRAHGLAGAVPQRRRRVFVVGYLGDWRRAAAVLFDGTSLRGDPPPRREAGQNVAPTISARPTGGGGLGTDFDLDGGQTAVSVPPVSVTLTARDRKGPLPEADLSTVVVSHALRGEGHDASEDGTGRGTPIIAFSSKDHGADAIEDVSPTVRAGTHDGSHANAGVPPAVAYDVTAFDSKDMALGSDGATSTLTTNGSQPGKAGGRLAFASSWAVRRLTPTECARLQGFPDDYLSQVKHRGKPPADGPMYKALGNSMAVNCMRILGERIQMVEDRYGKD